MYVLFVFMFGEAQLSVNKDAEMKIDIEKHMVMLNNDVKQLLGRYAIMIADVRKTKNDCTTNKWLKPQHDALNSLLTIGK